MRNSIISIFRKEIRTTRPITVSFAIICLGTCLIPNEIVSATDPCYNAVVEIMLILYLCLTALVSTSFSKEMEDGTLNYLRNLPVTPQKILIGKLFSILVNMFLLLIIAGTVLFLVCGPKEIVSLIDRIIIPLGRPVQPENIQRAVRVIVSVFFIPLDLIVWGLFWTLQCRRQISSIFQTIFCALLMSSFFIYFSSLPACGLNDFVWLQILRILILVILGIITDGKLRNWFYLLERKKTIDKKLPWRNYSLIALFRQGERQIRLYTVLYFLFCAVISAFAIFFLVFMPDTNSNNKIFCIFLTLMQLAIVCFAINIFHFDLNANNLILQQRRIGPLKLWSIRLLQYGSCVFLTNLPILIFICLDMNKINTVFCLVVILEMAANIFFMTVFFSALVRSRLIAGTMTLVVSGWWSFIFYRHLLLREVTWIFAGYTLVLFIGASYWTLRGRLLSIGKYRLYGPLVPILLCAVLPLCFGPFGNFFRKYIYEPPKMFYPSVKLVSNSKEDFAFLEKALNENENFIDHLITSPKTIRVRYFTFEVKEKMYSEFFESAVEQLQNFDFKQYPVSAVERLMKDPDLIDLPITRAETSPDKKSGENKFDLRFLKIKSPDYLSIRSIPVLKPKIGTLVFSVDSDRVSRYQFTARSILKEEKEPEQICWQWNPIRNQDQRKFRTVCIELKMSHDQKKKFDQIIPGKETILSEEKSETTHLPVTNFEYFGHLQGKMAAQICQNYDRFWRNYKCVSLGADSNRWRYYGIQRSESLFSWIKGVTVQHSFFCFKKRNDENETWGECFFSIDDYEGHQFKHKMYFSDGFFYIKELDRSFPQYYAETIDCDNDGQTKQGTRFVVFDPESFQLASGISARSLDDWKSRLSGD